MESNLDAQQSTQVKSSTKPGKALTDIRDICEESIYDFVSEKVRLELEKRGKYDFEGRLPSQFETRPIYTNDNGDKYLGQWNPATGKREGQGITVWANNGEIYEGYYKNGQRNGRGRYIYYNGNVYEGEWKDDKRYGYGVWTGVNRNAYKGHYKNDL